MLIKIIFKEDGAGKNIFFNIWIDDNLLKEVKGEARWVKTTKRPCTYTLNREGKLRYIEYINDTWYWIAWSDQHKRFFINETFQIEKLEIFELGTKAKPILSEEDRKCNRLVGVVIGWTAVSSRTGHRWDHV